MVAQSDKELFPWLMGVMGSAGQFLRSLADAGLRADPENYRILRPTLLEFKDKYPKYYEEELVKMRRDGYDG